MSFPPFNWQQESKKCCYREISQDICTPNTHICTRTLCNKYIYIVYSIYIYQYIAIEIRYVCMSNTLFHSLQVSHTLLWDMSFWIYGMEVRIHVVWKVSLWTLCDTDPSANQRQRLMKPLLDPDTSPSCVELRTTSLLRFQVSVGLTFPVQSHQWFLIEYFTFQSGCLSDIPSKSPRGVKGHRFPNWCFNFNIVI